MSNAPPLRLMLCQRHEGEKLKLRRGFWNNSYDGEEAKCFLCFPLRYEERKTNEETGKLWGVAKW